MRTCRLRGKAKAIGSCAVTRLDKLITEIEADTVAVVQTNDIPTTVAHYAYVRELHDLLKERITALGRHVESLSYQILPTRFMNLNVKTISLPVIGRGTINVGWSASMFNKICGHGMAARNGE